MDFSQKRESLPPAPANSHRTLFRHHYSPQYLELSPDCPQHGGYHLRPISHHHRHSAAANGHHHHHHLELSPDCPLHGHLLPPCPIHSSNFHSNYQSATSFPIIPNFSSFPLPQNPNIHNLNSIQPEDDTNSKSESLMMNGRNEEDEDENEEEEEFVFVLTDEWKEFFAKSEAKRRLAKKQAKKKGKA